MEKGKIIILDGSPSAGKTTVAEAIQNLAEEPFLYAGIDAFVRMFPSKWISFQSHCTDTPGIEFIFSKDAKGHSTIEFSAGNYGHRFIQGYIQAIKGLAEAGNHVIADGVITEQEWLTYLRRSLEGFKFCFVGLYAPLDILEERERQRWEPEGMARGRFDAVYSLQKNYDLFIDTSITSPEKAANMILKLKPMETH